MEDAPGPRSTFRVVSPHYFETIGQRLVRGRAFGDGDDEKATRGGRREPGMARHYFGDATRSASA